MTHHSSSQVSEQEKYDLGIYHDYDDAANRVKLQGLYGKVAEQHDQWIMRFLHGRKVLDVGAGYGFLSKRLKDAGYDVVAIDPSPRAREFAKLWYGIDILPVDIQQTSFEGKQFDSAILREMVEHVDFEQTVREVRRIVRQEVIIFQSNLTFFVRFARWILRHKEFNEQPLEYYCDVLRREGFEVKSVVFCDIIALPVSGGLLARQWFPLGPRGEAFIIALDRSLCSFLNRVGLARYLCWRFCIHAVLEGKSKEN